MRLQRSLLQTLFRGFLGLCLIFSIHACQSVQPPQTPAATNPATSQATSQPTAAAPLPPETAAIVSSAGPSGLTDPPRGDVRFVVISDLNQYYGSTAYDPEVDKGMKLIPFWKPDMVLCGGDMVAGQDPSLTEAKMREMWAGFDKQVAAPLRNAKLPYGFTIGNHDASSALGVQGSFLFQKERNLAAEYWKDPAHDPGVKFVDKFEFPFYYTFEFKDIFFLVWDGSSNHIPSEKMAWIEKSLSSEKAQKAKMRILLGHLPLYAVAIGRNDAAEVMESADELRTMLEKYNVHTYISGHHHAYYPAHKGNLQLLHMGILGSGPRPLIDGTPPRKAITVMDIKFDSPELTTYTTYDIQTLKQIAYKELPRYLTGVNGMVLRRDVDNLSAAEQINCENILNSGLCSA